MFKTTAALMVSLLALSSQPLFAAAGVTVAHFAPFADTLEGTSVYIQANGTTILEDVRFKDFTDRLELDAGTYTIDVIPTGATDPAISGDFTVEDGMNYIVYAVGNVVNQDLELWALSDDAGDPMMGNLNLRIVHAAPFAANLADTEVSIRTDGGDVVAGLVGVPYGVDSGFLEVPAGNYNLKIATNDGSVNLIDILPVDLPAGATVTVFAVGDVVNQPLAVMAVPVGELPTTEPVGNKSNGMWEVIEGSGTGFVLQPMPSQNRLVGTWYSYDMDGNPIFFTFDSCLEQEDDMGNFLCSTPGAFDGVTATTSLYASSGGGNSEDDVVVTMKIGEIDFEILGCNDATATVRLEGSDPAEYTARQLTRPFPCVDPAPAN